MDGVGHNISSFSKGFPVRSSLANLTIFINQAHSSIEDHYPQLDQADFYRSGPSPRRETFNISVETPKNKTSKNKKRFKTFSNAPRA